jgi:hypothetical protein
MILTAFVKQPAELCGVMCGRCSASPGYPESGWPNPFGSYGCVHQPGKALGVLRRALGESEIGVADEGADCG